jgi:hypothetical protein
VTSLSIPRISSSLVRAGVRSQMCQISGGDKGPYGARLVSHHSLDASLLSQISGILILIEGRPWLSVIDGAGARVELTPPALKRR